MELPLYLDSVRANARKFVDAARRAGVEASVPTCPDWTVADLCRHQGRVFHWMGTMVETKAQEYVDRRPFEEEAERSDPLAFLEGGAEYALIRQSKESLGQQRLNLEQVRDQFLMRESVPDAHTRQTINLRKGSQRDYVVVAIVH